MYILSAYNKGWREIYRSNDLDTITTVFRDIRKSPFKYKLPHQSNVWVHNTGDQHACPPHRGNLSVGRLRP